MVNNLEIKNILTIYVLLLNSIVKTKSYEKYSIEHRFDFFE